MGQEWLDTLESWTTAHGLTGYDPFDARAHPVVRALQPFAPARKGVNLLLDLFPRASRRLLGIRPTLNAKAFALAALGELRLYQITGDAVHLERAREHLSWLLAHPCADAPGLCWGYPFDVSGKNIHRPAGTPVGVVSAVAGEAFTLAAQLTEDGAYRKAVHDIAEFFLRGLNQLPQEDGTLCFSYTPADRWPVHNANLHAAAHLFRAHALTGDESWLEKAVPSLEFTLQRQRPDGSWPYGEWSPGCGYERALLEQVDHHHTGFVLRSLHEIHALTGRTDVREAVVRGFAYYREHLFTEQGIPRITNRATYPVNIHACTEAILCPAIMNDLVPGALDFAERALLWTRRNMAHPKTGLPYYRRYPWFANKMLFTRWGLAWLFYALAEYRFRTVQSAAPV